jgi:23S rRNA pseudouridine1911/1915/1917 synthase
MIDILYEDNHLLALNKPAMLPTMGVAENKPSLLSWAKEYVRRKYAKPGNVYLGVVSRLDAPVTGVVLLARTSKSAARLTQQFRDRTVEKIYWALVVGVVDPPTGRLCHHVRKDERHRRMHICAADAPGAQLAELTYRLLSTAGPTESQQSAAIGQAHAARGKHGPAGSCRLVEIQLLTGRKHQIRLQLADAGLPIVGDRKYGSRRTFPTGIALHAQRLVFEHPVRKMPLAIEAPLPASWPNFVVPPR